MLDLLFEIILYTVIGLIIGGIFGWILKRRPKYHGPNSNDVKKTLIVSSSGECQKYKIVRVPCSKYFN